MPSKRPQSPNEHYAPVLLTRVASRLRHIALSTPKLWGAIHISVPRLVSLAKQEEIQTLMAKRAEGVKE